MKVKYEDSIFYHINSCARYFHVAFEQFFKELNLGVNAMEHLALSIIAETKNCCQRDLARIILKDRAGTGKLVNILENKGLITIELTTKNNRPAKILTPTKKGIEINNEVRKILEPLSKQIRIDLNEETLDKTSETLKQLKKIVEKIIKTNI